MSSNAENRRRQILEDLRRSQVVRIAALKDQFHVSEVSIRRDLDHLETLGFLTRFRGGAVVSSCGAMHRPFAARLHKHLDEKERIGRAAAQLIAQGERLIFDSGTTLVHVARSIPRELLEAANLTVITASMPVVQELGAFKGTHLIVLGGIYLSDLMCAVGPQALNSLKDLNADKFFLGTDGATFSHGFTAANLLETEVCQAMIEISTEVIVVTDSSKIGLKGLTTIAPLAKVDRLITDLNAPSDFVEALRREGVDVMLV